MDLVKSTDMLRYLAIEGAIGAGKTTLAHLIAERMEAQLVLEEHEQNPFLERFYADRKRWGFQTQLSFLAARFRQQRALVERDLFHRVVVSDYIFEKDRLFARMNLEGDELHLYESLYQVMAPSVPRPDLIIYLQAPLSHLRENIAKRGRAFERAIPDQYLLALCGAYDQLLFRYTRSPVVIVDAANLDFVENPRALEELLRVVGTTRYSGVTFFRANL